MGVGFKIKQLREEKNMSQQDLAHALNISQSALCNIENELTDKIPFSLIDKICQIYNVNHSHFSENPQITNNVNENNGGVVGINYGEIINCPEKAVEAIKKIIDNYKPDK